MQITHAREPQTLTIKLRATEGHFITPDGSSIYFWGFTDKPTGPAQLPGPHIVAIQGDTLVVELTNELPENTSLLFPGQQGVLNVTGGARSAVKPVYEHGQLVSLVDYVAPGSTTTYQFVVNRPGTFLYQSGTNMHKQISLGLSGAIVVHPTGFDPHNRSTWTAYGPGTQTEFDREYLLIIGEVDPLYHQAVKNGTPYSLGDYKPRYWLMNGRCAPDTMFQDNIPYLPHQPYGSMVMAEPGERVLLRYVSVGNYNYPLHPHGVHTRVIARDGNLLRNGNQDLSYHRFTVALAPGQTYDQIYKWDGLGYDPLLKLIPTTLPQLRNQSVGDAGWTMWSGSPYLGKKGDIPVGVTPFNEMGEYYFMLHSHSEYQITNWGQFPGGAMTMIGIYPTGSLDPHMGTLG